MYDLNAPSTISGQSTRSRLSALTGADQSGLLSLYDVRLTKRYKISRFAKVIEFFAARDCLLSCPPSRSDSLDRLVDEARLCLGNSVPPLRVFTDGSSAPGVSQSGVGVVVWDGQDRVIHSLGFAVLTHGNNFFAEIVGVVFAAMIIPDVVCEVISDSKSVIDCLSQGKLSDRQWARLPCRGWWVD